jgi:hypothetical protein
MFSLKVTVEEDERRIFELKVSCESMKNLGKIIETVMQSLREVGLGSSESSEQFRGEKEIDYGRGLPRLNYRDSSISVEEMVELQLWKERLYREHDRKFRQKVGP